ncbi:MAG TPA: 3-hydroxyacyl-CoA dehydrogenase [Dongiaceae bacterium]|jgi:3-hydroxyacyl-CoA dehydrogenase|nr:3-hydroxyacyl-CoA dehydrogenase [Dongiaceae bacterium]
MPKIAIVGSGLIGRAWAITFARAGHEIRLYDEAAGQAEKAIAFAREMAAPLESEGLLNGQSADQVIARIKPAASLEAALDGVVHVQENTPEDLAVKQKVFARLDAVAAPETVLSSSTSAILPSKFTEHLKGRGRCLVMHPINPPYLIPAAEIVPAPWTDPATVEKTRQLAVASGQAPIVMKRELDGFVMNRMQGALLEEAFRLVADGYASVEDVDVGIREGLALRWSFMGPFETIDLNAPGGIKDYCTRYQQIYSRLFPSMQRRVDWSGEVMKTVEKERRERLPEKDLQKRQAWRDRRLMALIAQKRKAAKEIGS